MPFSSLLMGMHGLFDYISKCNFFYTAGTASGSVQLIFFLSRFSKERKNDLRGRLLFRGSWQNTNPYHHDGKFIHPTFNLILIPEIESSSLILAIKLLPPLWENSSPPPPRPVSLSNRRRRTRRERWPSRRWRWSRKREYLKRDNENTKVFLIWLDIRDYRIT